VPLSLPAAGGEPPKPADATILELGKGSFVGHLRWKTPSVVTKDGKLTPLLEPARKGQKEEDRKPRPAVAADPPAKDWAAPDYDDGRWVRLSEPLFLPGAPAGQNLFYVPGAPVEWDLFCLRGKFRVEDPAQVRDLRLALSYVGGARVLVNGQELCRGHLPEGNLDFDAPAEVYPEEAYAHAGKKADGKELMKARTRELASKGAGTGAGPGVLIPASMLRKGVNVVAVEVHAAPLVEAMLKENGPDNLNWSHAGVLDARLTAASGVSANVGPSQGIQLWTSQQMETDKAWHYAHPADGVRPIRMVGARNGSFSGKVVLSSAAAIKGLKASASELAGADGKSRIPAASVQVRWAEKATPAVRSGMHWDVPCRVEIDRLIGEFPAEIPALTLRAGNWGGTVAVVPVWVTVRVPADAPAGEYKGALTIEAAGLKTTAVPVQLQVNDWRIPDPKDFTIHHNIYQSPDSVARYYKVPLWSDKHWELMGKSLEVLAQAGNKLCVIPLAVNSPAMENTESMVRWVRKKEVSGVSVQVSGSENKAGNPAPDTRNLTPDTYSYDFSILDKYLDLYAAKCGKPGILQLSAWENSDRGRLEKKDQPPPPLSVTAFDPAAGKTEMLVQPPYGTPENEAFWKPVFTELRKRLEKRGWFDVAAALNANYCLDALPENVTVFKHLWPDGKWMSATHSCPERFGGKAKEDAMPVPYVEWVWGAGSLYDPDYGDRKKTPFYPRAWKRGNERILLANVRYGVGIVRGLYDGSPFVLYRTMSEAALQGGLRGIGRVGGDFWPLPIAKADQFRAIGGNYGGCSWRENVMAMTSPGPDGAAFNTRLETFREGVQTAEAILFVQRALESGKVGEDLAKRAAALLDERARYYLRAFYYFTEVHLNNGMAWTCSNWQERDDRLFALAAEVAKVAGK
jgi:hypothetical protein